MISNDDFMDVGTSDGFTGRNEEYIREEALLCVLKEFNLCWNQQKPLDMNVNK